MGNDDSSDGRRVPSGRLSRLGIFGRMATGVAGGMIAEGARRIADGQRPRVADMLLTPANVGRVADQLAHLRGAAMKIGQMLSMDAGDVLPPELTAILARLRDRGYRMPPDQLQRVLASAWGRGWRRRFLRFNATPIAAASIGQVHRATTRDGRELAIKVQYPGVADSIDADVDNVATLLKLTRLLPDTLDIGPLLEEAKRQLRDEADYAREAEQMARFGSLLAGDDRFIVPTPHDDLTTPHVLAMDFVPGVAVERLEDEAQAVRDTVLGSLIDLVLDELFTLGLMQTDPNFANYRWQPDRRRIVLLDFGAARPVAAPVQTAYRRLLAAGLSGNRDAVREAAIAAGFMGEAAATRHRAAVDRIVDVILANLGREGAFDFGDRRFVAAIREEAMVLAADRATWHLPPAELLFVQRKISGTALLAARLGARVDIRTKTASKLGLSVS